MNPTANDNYVWTRVLRFFLWTQLFRESDQSPMDGYKVLKVYASTNEDVRNLRHVKNTYSLDPWKEVRTANSTGEYLVSPDHLYDVMNTFSKWNLKHEQLIVDVPGFLKNHTVQFNRNRWRRDADFRYRYLPFDEINIFLRHMRDNAKDVNVRLDSIGQSYEGRETPYVKISRNPKEKKPILFIDAGIHSREWISPAMAVEIIRRLALNEEKDPMVNSLLDKFDWLIVPVVNPDGYVFTFKPEEGNRLWRKSRTVNHSNNPACFGVDLNRNFGFAWNDNPFYGGSSDPCSGTYSGPYSFSEPETRNLRNVLLSNRDDILGYVSLHSFGQFFLYPWGFSSEVDIEDEKDLHEVATAFADTMRTKNYHYNVGGTAKILYPAAGGSDDYVRGTVAVKYAYIIELPPHETSKYGFLLPEDNIKEIVNDTWAGLKAFTNHLHEVASRNL